MIPDRLLSILRARGARILTHVKLNSRDAFFVSEVLGPLTESYILAESRGLFTFRYRIHEELQEISESTLDIDGFGFYKIEIGHELMLFEDKSGIYGVEEGQPTQYELRGLLIDPYKLALELAVAAQAFEEASEIVRLRQQNS